MMERVDRRKDIFKFVKTKALKTPLLIYMSTQPLPVGAFGMG